MRLSNTTKAILHSFTFTLAILILACGANNSVLAQKVTKTSATLEPLAVRVTPEPAAIISCSSSNSRVHLTAATNSSNSNQLRYSWSTNAGRIIGDGSAVVWDLTGIAPGIYKAFVSTYSGSGTEEECEAFSSTAVLVGPCGLPAPSCPTVSIVCPQDLGPGKPLIFSATLTGGSTEQTPTYNWVVSSGQIVEGQGTSSIKVDNTGLGGQSITAILSLDGYNLDCSASCTISIPVPVIPPRKFDEFPEIARNDEKARLDNFAIELQNDPRATAYVIVYPSTHGGSVEAQRRITRIVDYLVNTRAVDSHRIVTQIGPARRTLQVQLWTVPPGANPPVIPEH